MKRFFDRSFGDGADRVVLVGSDAPTLNASIIEGAFRSLRERPVVMGPSGDGGYYLIGAARATPPVFGGVTWSSPQVWAQTLQRLSDARLEHEVLEEQRDIDDIEDLLDLRRRLTAGELACDEDRVLRDAVLAALKDGTGLGHPNRVAAEESSVTATDRSADPTRFGAARSIRKKGKHGR